MSHRRVLSTVFILVTALILLLAPTAAGAVVFVSASGAGDFSSIQSAIDASADGDIVLVTPGNYSDGLGELIIDDKALTIAAAPSGAEVLHVGLEIKDLAAGKSVVVRGLKLVPFLGGIETHVEVRDCSGSVWFEDCEIVGADGGALFNMGYRGDPGVVVTNSQAVSFTRCSMTGGAGYPGFTFASPGDGGHGVEVGGASVALHDCAIVGGLGGTSFPSGAFGGDGMRVTQSELLVSGCSVEGGDGFIAPAAGLRIVDTFSSVAWLDSAFLGGQLVSTGATGDGIAAPPGTVSSWPAAARSLEVSSPQFQFAPVTVELAGQGGDQVFIFWNVVGDHLFIPGTQGWLLLGVPLQGPFFLSTLPPTGEQSFVVNAPPLFPSTLPGFSFVLQGYFVNGAEIVAGSGSAFTLVSN